MLAHFNIITHPRNHYHDNIFNIIIHACKDGQIEAVGHLQREIARAMKFLMGTMLHAEVTSQRYRRSTLVQVGLALHSSARNYLIDICSS